MSHLKIESARRQLGTAMALYLEDRDPVSVHCLAGGACELLDFYARKGGGNAFTSHILSTVPELDIAEVYRLQRQYWNAFKHATHGRGREERDDDELLARFSDERNDTAFFIGWHDYAEVTGGMPLEAQVHQSWYIALHPEKLAPEHSAEPFFQLFPDLKHQSRHEQKRMLRRVIEVYRHDEAIMSDPMTDARDLVINWAPI
ncbi:MAG: hypothetical protein GEU95_17675 [Rhizobiales bacterium]|nr:hypothetical protein [Hyphomicrobiales bacterium]